MDLLTRLSAIAMLVMAVVMMSSVAFASDDADECENECKMKLRSCEVSCPPNADECFEGCFKTYETCADQC